MLRFFVASCHGNANFSVIALKKSGGQNFFSPGSPKILTVFCYIYFDTLLICILEPITLVFISGLQIGLVQIFVKRHEN